MKLQQTITEFETEFRSLVEIANNPDLADACKSEVEQAKDFKELTTTSNIRRLESGSAGRRISTAAESQLLTSQGYPQTMTEAVNKAKTVERQVLLKRNRNNQQTGRRRDDKKSTTSQTQQETTKHPRDSPIKKSCHYQKTPKQANTVSQSADTARV